MSIEQQLNERSEGKCELCGSTEGLGVYTVLPKEPGFKDNSVYTCKVCREQLEGNTEIDVNHWRCLNESMWSQEQPVQVVAWRMLNNLKSEGWPQDLLDMLYLEDELLVFAKSAGVAGQPGESEESIIHRDVNGVVLSAGDTVTLVKDLVVKGGNFTAKRGTAVRNIGLVHDNAEHIEGRVESQRIVILTQFVKKSN